MSFVLHHRHEDLRPLQWINYHQRDQGLFSLDLAYTGLVDLRGFANFQEYLQSLKWKRRYKFLRSEQAGLRIAESTDIETMLEMYRQNLARQDAAPAEETLNRLRRLMVAGFENGFGELLFAHDDENNRIAAASLFFFDAMTAYWITSAFDPIYKKQNVGTFVLLNHFASAIARKNAYVDVVGMNSPRRGDYKSECGAQLKPYFVSRWRRGGVSP